MRPVDARTRWNDKVLIKARELEEQLAAVVSNATGHVELLGAAELLARASAAPIYTSQLAVQDNALDGISYVVFVKLRDYLAFLTDEKGSLRRHLFDLNVRDYRRKRRGQQGDSGVSRRFKGTRVLVAEQRYHHYLFQGDERRSNLRDR